MNKVLDSIIHEENLKHTYVKASKGKRFTNYIIDTIAIYLFSMIFGAILGIVLVLTGNEAILLEEEEYSIGGKVLEILLSFLIYFSYYLFFEYTFKGKTPGKFITKTRAVTLSSEKMNLNTCIKRSLCRLMPFESFTYLGDNLSGFHDNSSDTKVIIDEGWIDSTSL